MLNDALDGKSWKEHKVKKSQIYSRNAKTMGGLRKDLGIYEGFSAEKYRIEEIYKMNEEVITDWKKC